MKSISEKLKGYQCTLSMRSNSNSTIHIVLHKRTGPGWWESYRDIDADELYKPNKLSDIIDELNSELILINEDYVKDYEAGNIATYKIYYCPTCGSIKSCWIHESMTEAYCGKCGSHITLHDQHSFEECEVDEICTTEK